VSPIATSFRAGSFFSMIVSLMGILSEMTAVHQWGRSICGLLPHQARRLSVL
jgi:hypothetical protein